MMTDTQLRQCRDAVDMLDQLGERDMVELAKWCRLHGHDLGERATKRRIWKELGTLFTRLKK